MTDFVISIFRLSNRRGLLAPFVNAIYEERESGIQWRVSVGGSRAYFVRIGERLAESFDEQAADSHFMVGRVCSALLLSGAGLFEGVAVGRLMFRNAHGDIEWDTHHDLSNSQQGGLDDKIADWYQAVCTHTFLRRAADDARLALSFPHEAFVFVYRGFEWIKEGLGISWDDLANDIGVAPAHLRDMKKAANVGTGVRHASRSGVKLRADAMNYATWICGLFDAINAARQRLDGTFRPMRPEDVAEAVLRAAPMIPYE